MTKRELANLQKWHWNWRYGFGYEKLVGGRGKKDGFAYGHCSCDKIRAWYFLKEKLTEPRILSATCQHFTVAGIYKKKGIVYFFVDTGIVTDKSDGIHEIPLSELEG